MELIDYFRFALALVFVLGLIGACAWAAKRFGLMARASAPRAAPRLAIVEVRPIDARRKLVLVARDGAQHLLLLGGERDLLVEANIQPPAQNPARTDNGTDPARIIAFSSGNNL